MANRGIFRKIFETVAQIPPGRVATYGQIALHVGNPRLARRVGQALACVPDGLSLPCHRVIRRDGSLAPEHVFEGRQRALLEAEGIPFLPDGRVELSRCQWEGLVPDNTP